jgi:hypothetical protein
MVVVVPAFDKSKEVISCYSNLSFINLLFSFYYAELIHFLYLFSSVSISVSRSCNVAQSSKALCHQVTSVSAKESPTSQTLQQRNVLLP